jgi:glycosyltransferase involved in cell wall biosynthesis
MNRKTFLSAIVLAKNEEARIEGCLKGVSWADEIIVIDSGSTDRTLAIAKKYNAKIIVHVTDNFSLLRTIGAKKATGKWLLYVDADERVTDDLRKEIMEVTKAGARQAYVIPRLNYYLGVAWPYKDGMVRLIAKRALVGWTGILHEHAEVRGKTGTLTNYFVHNTHRTLSEMVEKTNIWSEHEAELRFHARHPGISWWRILRVMATSFWDSFIRQGGWRAGTVGWIESIYQAFSIFITYAKLWELQQKKYEKSD